jgi:hypothetical protein
MGLPEKICVIPCHRIRQDSAECRGFYWMNFFYIIDYYSCCLRDKGRRGNTSASQQIFVMSICPCPWSFPCHHPRPCPCHFTFIFIFMFMFMFIVIFSCSYSSLFPFSHLSSYASSLCLFISIFMSLPSVSCPPFRPSTVSVPRLSLHLSLGLLSLPYLFFSVSPHYFSAVTPLCLSNAFLPLCTVYCTVQNYIPTRLTVFSLLRIEPLQSVPIFIPAVLFLLFCHWTQR